MTWVPADGIPTAANDSRWSRPAAAPAPAPVGLRRTSEEQRQESARRASRDRRACALTVELALCQIRAKAAGRKIPDRPLL